MENKKYKYGLLLIVSMLAVSLMVKADDENDDEEHRTISNQSALSNQTAQTETVTSTKVITLPDSDGDGLLDKDDPHPNIAEIYIVTDDDKNGIVDSFEK